MGGRIRSMRDAAVAPVSPFAVESAVDASLRGMDARGSFELLLVFWVIARGRDRVRSGF